MNYLGVPKSRTTEGNKFCFSFFESHMDTALMISIGTLESFPVEYQISSGKSTLGSGVIGINRTNTVKPGSINREYYQYAPGNVGDIYRFPFPYIMTFNFSNNRNINDFTGIEIKTINSSHTISVTCFTLNIYNFVEAASFVAVPLFNVGSITQQYNYSIFNELFVDYTDSVAAIVVCDTIEAGGVSLTYSNASIPGDYFGTYDQHGVRSSQIKFEKYYTPSISSLPPGTDVYAIQPIGFMIGHACVSGYTLFCNNLIQQVPPSYTWGYNFLIGPFRHKAILKIFPGKETGTNFKLFCAYNNSVTIDELVQNFTKADHMDLNRGIINIGFQDSCTVRSNKPLAVILYFQRNIYRGPLSTMVWIPPVSQYLNRYLVDFSFHSTVTVYVTVLPHCFDASAILDNGTALESNASNWRTFHCDKITDICGYGVPVRPADIRREIHLLNHADPSCSFGAIIFEFDFLWGGYVYPAGYGMRPIGGNSEYNSFNVTYN